jgi:hypothetical protein
MYGLTPAGSADLGHATDAEGATTAAWPAESPISGVPCGSAYTGSVSELPDRVGGAAKPRWRQPVHSGRPRQERLSVGAEA